LCWPYVCIYREKHGNNFIKYSSSKYLIHRYSITRPTSSAGRDDTRPRRQERK
jgi:hypothetical protein